MKSFNFDGIQFDISCIENAMGNDNIILVTTKNGVEYFSDSTFMSFKYDGEIRIIRQNIADYHAGEKSMIQLDTNRDFHSEINKK